MIVESRRLKRFVLAFLIYLIPFVFFTGLIKSELIVKPSANVNALLSFFTAFVISAAVFICDYRFGMFGPKDRD